MSVVQMVTAVDTVTAVENEDVVLPCSIPPETSIPNLELRWFREKGDELVSFFKDQREDLELPGDSYRGRAHLFTAELLDGNASLHLSRVQTSDADLYTCSAFVGLAYGHAEVELRVEGRQPLIEVTEEDRSELEQEDTSRSPSYTETELEETVLRTNLHWIGAIIVMSIVITLISMKLKGKAPQGPDKTGTHKERIMPTTVSHLQSQNRTNASSSARTRQEQEQKQKDSASSRGWWYSLTSFLHTNSPSTPQNNTPMLQVSPRLGSDGSLPPSVSTGPSSPSVPVRGAAQRTQLPHTQRGPRRFTFIVLSSSAIHEIQ
ncbi:ICOS ligand-like [Megalops cyprinoides]|uniref:ICOS ligand-like n=1 Tax=Megalops cyprinoides TaxID=118141 RepID=UPI0018643D8D|nr:ICOS ligand-like [Megalops cyprinoides]